MPVGLFRRYWYRYLLFTNTGRYRYFDVVDKEPYPRPVAVLVYKSDVPGHLY